MNSINVEKIQALKRYKQDQYKKTLIFYPIVGLTCVIFCTSPFWFPALYSYIKVFMCVSIPRIMGFFLNAKSLFIVGNLIVIFLLGEFKIKPTSRKINVSGGKKVKKLRVKKLPEITVKEAVTAVEEAVTVVEEAVTVVEEAVTVVEEAVTVVEAAVVVVEAAEGKIGGGGEVEKVVDATVAVAEAVAEELIPVLSTEELNRRADDFIAMVNKQIRLEAVEM